MVKSLQGATSVDMKHYIKPTITKNPDQVIIHIGTNDLQNTEPATIVDNIVNLATECSTDAKVTIYELVTRDDDELSAKVKETNRLLRRFCNQNQWDSISHKNINSSGLYRGGPHLNSPGLNAFQATSTDLPHAKIRPGSSCHFSDRKANTSDILPHLKGFSIASFNITSLIAHIEELRITMLSEPLDVLL